MLVGSIKLEVVLGIQKDWLGIQDYFNDIKESFLGGVGEENTIRMNIGYNKCSVLEEDRN